MVANRRWTSETVEQSGKGASERAASRVLNAFFTPVEAGQQLLYRKYLSKIDDDLRQAVLSKTWRLDEVSDVQDRKEIDLLTFGLFGTFLL